MSSDYEFWHGLGRYGSTLTIFYRPPNAREPYVPPNLWVAPSIQASPSRDFYTEAAFSPSHGLRSTSTLSHGHGSTTCVSV